MTTRTRNIYSIGACRRAACLVAVVASLALLPGQALAQCDPSGAAGDEYCEALPGAGGDRGAGSPDLGGGLSPRTGAALDRAGANALQRVESPRKKRARAGTKRSGSAATIPGSGSSESDSGTILWYILAALTLALLAAAAIRHFRGSGAEESPAA